VSDDINPDALAALIAERDELKQHLNRLLKEHGEKLRALTEASGYPPGHYYSPVVDSDDPRVVRAVRERLYGPAPSGVRLNRDAMNTMLRRLAAHHRLFPFSRDRGGPNRFWYDNPFFGCHDASVYFSMLLEFRPRRVTEVGCGFSSRLLLDVSERFFQGETEIALIDPSLSSVTGLNPPAGATLLSCRVQEAPLALFNRLEANDILFIDSSHVSKTGSDVNYYLFQILPRLKSGVLIHIHDIFWPFEYLADWVIGEKRSWNEGYLVHAFLQYNGAFEIVYWNNFVFHKLGAELGELMPLCLENEGGSLWIRKV
jgi:hypothetical protein